MLAGSGWPISLREHQWLSYSSCDIWGKVREIVEVVWGTGSLILCLTGKVDGWQQMPCLQGGGSHSLWGTLSCRSKQHDVVGKQHLFLNTPSGWLFGLWWLKAAIRDFFCSSTLLWAPPCADRSNSYSQTLGKSPPPSQTFSSFTILTDVWWNGWGTRAKS